MEIEGLEGCPAHIPAAEGDLQPASCIFDPTLALQPIGSNLAPHLHRGQSFLQLHRAP